MNYKWEKALKKNKKYYIMYSFFWIALALFMVLPLTVTVKEATVNGKFDLTIFMRNASKNIPAVFSNLGKVFKYACFGKLLKNLFWFTIAFFFFMYFGVKKLRPKSEYDEIEHGSSGWAAKGEQYEIISKNKGIILAEDNYLPVDKRGNVNVLIVGRIRFW